ncbi:N-acetyltransferase [Paenibacillus rhizophilus]|uniref:N-acetyltransferase n=2 Tax=Paenibacillus rhizophilus TaxID=1850366 RepID=A0A3N9NZA0_9BACL|nr:N-acetyltransferase [Paenibacillus rhizophilus]
MEGAPAAGTLASAQVAAGTAAEDIAPEKLVPVQEGDGFVLRENGTLIGEVTFLPLQGINTWLINYTYVAPLYRGKGIAKLLLDRVVSEARRQNKQIVPACSYAFVQFRDHSEYADVWRR